MSRNECIFALLLLSVQATAQGPVYVLQNPAAGANQNIVQLPDTTMHNPSSFSTNNEAGILYVVSSFNWSQSPGVKLTGGQPNTVTLNPCPAGMLVLPSRTQQFTRIWIADNNQNLSEAVVLAPTTSPCPLQGGSSGTITFTPANTHTAGAYTLGSASQGIQEAVNAATLFSTNPDVSQPSKVIIPPGPYTALARISILGSKQYVDANGAVLTCKIADTCVFIGDVGGGNNANFTADVTIDGLAVQAGYAGRQTAIEDDASHTTLRGISTRNSSNGGTFFSVIQIDNDQSAVIEKFNPGSQNNWAHCGTDWCSVAIYAPGPFSTNAGVLWVKDSVIAAQCTFNGIDNQDANTLRVSDTVVEAYPQFGIRAAGSSTNVAATLDNVSMEGGCTNPLGVGIAGFISEGYTSVMHGTAPAGVLPQFGSGTVTAELYAYYIAIHGTINSQPVVSAPYLAGWAYTNLPTTIKWPQPPATNGGGSTLTYDVIRQTVTNLGANTAAPYGGGNTKVTTTVTCTGGICSAVDNGQTASNYTVVSPSTYAPALTFWPGSVILTEPTDSGTTNGGEPRLYTDIVGPSTSINLGGLINSYGANAPTVFAQQCSGLSTWSSIWVSCPAGDSVSNNFPAIGALLLQTGNEGNDDNPSGLKGRLNLMAPSGLASPTHLITLGDSNPAKTLATPGHRPSNDVNDTWIGLDAANGSASTFQLAFGAPVSISSYIGNVGDNLNFLERLSSTGKTFNTPITANFQINSNLPTSSHLAPFTVKSTMPVDVLTVSNHPTIQYCGTGATCQAAAQANGQIVFGKITLTSSPQDMGGINPAFQHNTYNCLGNDLTTPTDGVSVVPKNTTTVTFTGAVGDTISYQCVGS